MATEAKKPNAPPLIEGETLFTIALGGRDLILARDVTRRDCVLIYVRYSRDDGTHVRYVARARTDSALRLAGAFRAAAEEVERRDVAAPNIGCPQPKGGSPVASPHRPGVPTDGKRTSP